MLDPPCTSLQGIPRSAFSLGHGCLVCGPEDASTQRTPLCAGAVFGFLHPWAGRARPPRLVFRDASYRPIEPCKGNAAMVRWFAAGSPHSGHGDWSGGQSRYAVDPSPQRDCGDKSGTNGSGWQRTPADAALENPNKTPGAAVSSGPQRPLENPFVISRSSVQVRPPAPSSSELNGHRTAWHAAAGRRRSRTAGCSA